MEIAPYMPPPIDSSIEVEWSWYGHTPADPRSACSV
jgi:hypothetical protein